MPSQALILTTTLVAIAGSSLAFYLRHRHHTLCPQVTSRHICASERSAAVSSRSLESLPKRILDSPQHYRIIHALDSISLSSNLSSHLQTQTQQAETLFTGLMRRNMISFSTYLPQAYLLRLLSKTSEQKRSFSTSYIAKLDFKEADLVCGVYHVLVRRGRRVEMSMSAPAAGLPESLGGRLVTSIVAASGTWGESSERKGAGGDKSSSEGDGKEQGGLVLQTGDAAVG